MYASGFRNVFGLGFNGATGELFASDNGPSCDDELNLITAGGNYGWRLNQPCNDSNYIQPLIRINPPIAPTGLIASPTAVSSHFKDNILLADFNHGYITRMLVIDGSVVETTNLITGAYGSIIDLKSSQSGRLVFCTQSSIYEIVVTS